MATQVQNRRGSTVEHSTFTGAVGEVTVDTDKEVVVVHDGTTAGGYPQMRENGSQNLVTTGSVTGGRFIPTSSTVPTNGVYLPAANSVAISTGGSGRLFVDANGNVGVGVASPQGTLSVEGEGRVVTIGDSGTANRPIIKSRNLANDAYAYLHYDAFEHRFFDSGVLSQINGQNTHVFYTSNTERLRITSAGLVGIGTSAPGTLLDVVNGTGRIRTGGKVGSNNYLKLESTDASDTMELRFSNSTNANWQIQSVENNVAFRPLALNPLGGNVGIGTTSPGVPLDVVGAIRSTSGTIDARIQAGYSGAVGIGAQSNDPVLFIQNATERARIDSSGRLLVGTSSALSVNNVTAGVEVHSTATTNGASVSIARFNNDSSGSQLILGKSRNSTVAAGTIVQNGDDLGQITFNGDDGTDLNTSAARIQAFVDGTPGANDMPGRLVFSTTADGASSPTERMRITSGGDALIGKQVADNTTSGLRLAPDFASFVRDGNVALILNRLSSDGNIADFRRSGTIIGSISVTTTATAYNTSSDYRLKENVTAVTDGIARLQQLKPSRFNFIADPDKTVDGFIAHEVQDVVPEAITGKKDAVDDEGNSQYQGIDQSKLVPLLTAALQEAVAKIESLEARLTAAGI